MKLISCDNCGVVLDANKLDFPYIDPTDPCDPNHKVWDNDNSVWVSAVPCPVCKSKIVTPN